MSQIPSTSQEAPPSPLFAADNLSLADPDYALGCECADPHLTIEMWSSHAESASISEPHH